MKTTLAEFTDLETRTMRLSEKRVSALHRETRSLSEGSDEN